VVLANKADTRPAACAAQLQRLRKAVPAHWPLFVGSAKESAGLEDVLVTLGATIQAVDDAARREAEEQEEQYARAAAEAEAEAAKSLGSGSHSGRGSAGKDTDGR